MYFLLANRIAPDGTPQTAASHLGLHCLPMSHKKDDNEMSKRTKQQLGDMRSYIFDSLVGFFKLTGCFSAFSICCKEIKDITWTTLENLGLLLAYLLSQQFFSHVGTEHSFIGC